MGLPVEVNNLMMGSLGGYNINRSLRFRSSASAYLSKTFASAGNQQRFTMSFWCKRGSLGASGINTSGYSGGGASQGGAFVYFAADTLIVCQQTNNSNDWILQTTQVFRDPSAWYYFTIAIDTTQATASNRVKIYVNGVQITSFSSSSYPTLNLNTKFNATNQRIAAVDDNGNPYLLFDGYLAEVNFIDGQQLTPSSFGAYDTNGVWQPKKYTGTYGTNGFYLPFSNTTSTTTLVQDSSGNGNNWTPNNISLTAVTTYDSMIDSPTNSASSSNYAVLNPLNTQISGSAVLQNANLQLNATSATYVNSKSTITASSLNCYCEMTVTTQSGSNGLIGIGVGNSIANIATGDGSYITYRQNGQIISYPGNTLVATVSSYTQGDIIGMTATSSQVAFYKNNSLQGTYNHNLSGDFFVVGMAYNATNTAVVDFNFGQRPFSYTPPSGYSALNTYNLPAATINNGALYMAATTFTGNGSTQAITNGGNNTLGTTFQPDWIWIKNRSSISSQIDVDSVRGASNVLVINTNTAESSQPNYVTTINSNGFSLGNGSGGAIVDINQSGQSYIGWQWKAAGSTVSNTSGSITSTVSANPTAGFSVLTFTATGANATVGHGLGVAPSMIIAKGRTGTQGWPVYHVGLTSAAYYLEMQSTNGQVSAPTVWNSTSPTSSVFSIGSAFGNTLTFVAYCFAAIPGFSAFGSYTGNGSSTDGPFIYTGFRPRWLMIKRIDTTDDWPIEDTSRNPYNVDTLYLLANSGAAEGTVNLRDLLSNGFKVRAVAQNTNGGTYVYAAFAENPFNISRAR